MRKFQPKINQVYFMINSRFQVKETFHTGSARSTDRIAAGNAFKTRDDALEFRGIILQLRRGKLEIKKKSWWRFL